MARREQGEGSDFLVNGPAGSFRPEVNARRARTGSRKSADGLVSNNCLLLSRKWPREINCQPYESSSSLPIHLVRFEAVGLARQLQIRLTERVTVAKFGEKNGALL